MAPQPQQYPIIWLEVAERIILSHTLLVLLTVWANLLVYRF